MYFYYFLKYFLIGSKLTSPSTNYMMFYVFGLFRPTRLPPDAQGNANEACSQLCVPYSNCVLPTFPVFPWRMNSNLLLYVGTQYCQTVRCSSVKINIKHLYTPQHTEFTSHRRRCAYRITVSVRQPIEREALGSSPVG